MTVAFSPGELLLGKYRVQGVIGHGGMGIIVAAHHEQLGERVALKFLRDEILVLPEAVQRFMSEARAAIRIKSEHVARVIDVGTLEDGTPFIVMEYLEGETLSAFATRVRPIAVEAAIEFMLQICEAIAEAHALGIVHRDLKPANVFVTRRADGILAAKVLDFGISKANETLATGDHRRITDDLVALGSPAYCSPEQIQSPKQVDARSDLWSLGVILYELLSGKLPFDDDQTVRLCGKVLHEEAVPLASLRADLPSGLCVAVERCLQKLPDRRFSNVGQLAVALAPYAPARCRASVERIIRTVHASGMPDAATVELPQPDSEWGGRKRRPARSVWQRAAVLAPIVGVAGVGAYLGSRELEASENSPNVFVIESAAPRVAASAAQPGAVRRLRAADAHVAVSAEVAPRAPTASAQPKPKPALTTNHRPPRVDAPRTTTPAPVEPRDDFDSSSFANRK